MSSNKTLSKLVKQVQVSRPAATQIPPPYTCTAWKKKPVNVKVTAEQAQKLQKAIQTSRFETAAKAINNHRIATALVEAKQQHTLEQVAGAANRATQTAATVLAGSQPQSSYPSPAIVPSVPNSVPGTAPNTVPDTSTPPTSAPQAAPAMSADEAFILQFVHERYNPTGPNFSSNCGPASLAMAMAYTGRMPPGLTKEQQVDYARAIMSPSRSSEFTWIQDANGNSVPQLDRDSELTGGDMTTNGVNAAGGDAEVGYGWDQLDAALENGPVLSYGYTNDAWRGQFPERMGSGDVGHVNTILGKTEDGLYIVADPLHTGGPVLMTREQLSVFYGPTGGQPSFTGTNFGATGPASAPGVPGAPGTPSTQPGTPVAGSSGVPQTDLQYSGGTHYDPEVEKLQHSLVAAGYMTAEEMATGPGYYGPRTQAAVAALQRDHGIADDGTHFGPQTRAALTQVLGSRPADGTSPPIVPVDGPVQGPGTTAPAGPVEVVNGIELSAKDAALARRIDEMIASRYPTSTMQGYGAVIVDACRKEGVPVDLVLAQLAKESTFLRPDNTLSIANKNPGNLRFAEWQREFGGQPGAGNFTAYPSVEQGIRAYVHLLNMPIYREDVNNRDWASLVSKYAPSSDGNNEAEYVAQLHEWTAMFAGLIGVDFDWVNNP